MPRTDADAVGGLLEVDVDIDLDPFIESANFLVTKVCVVADSGYDDVQLEIIERYLAAHFYGLRDPSRTQEQIDVVRDMFETNKVDLGLQLTRWGQQALRFDTNGYLAALDNAVKDVTKPLPGGLRNRSIMWLGDE